MSRTTGSRRRAVRDTSKTPPPTIRGLREILVEAANALADAIEGMPMDRPRAKGSARAHLTSSVEREMTELDERNERIRLAYVERAEGDRRQLEAKAKTGALSTEETVALALLQSGYRLEPDARDELGLTSPLLIREKGERLVRRRKK